MYSQITNKEFEDTYECYFHLRLGYIALPKD